MSYPPVGLTPDQIENLNSLPKLHFGASSVDTINVSTDALNPSYVTGISLFASSSTEFSVADAATGALVHNADRALTMRGSVTYQVDNGTGGTAQFLIWSERSDDNGATWTINQGSLRTSEVSNTSASSQTKSSAIGGWEPGQWNRFVFANVGAGSLTLAPPLASVDGGSVSGFSYYFQLNEV